MLRGAEEAPHPFCLRRSEFPVAGLKCLRVKADEVILKRRMPVSVSLKNVLWPSSGMSWKSQAAAFV